MTASKFIKFLEDNNIDFDVPEADNILNYDQGTTNVEVEGLNPGESILFVDGKYADADVDSDESEVEGGG
jgi:hypothetical protein